MEKEKLEFDNIYDWFSIKPSESTRSDGKEGIYIVIWKKKKKKSLQIKLRKEILERKIAWKTEVRVLVILLDANKKVIKK